jgi:hypothetical protein
MPDTVVRSILRLPPDLHVQLVAWAKEEDRSLNNLIVRVLRRAVAEHGVTAGAQNRTPGDRDVVVAE